MRMHNHDFKEQDWTNFESNYKKNFAKPEGETTGGRVKNDDSKGAIVLGNHQMQMISTNAAEFTKKQVDHKDNLVMKQALQQTSALVLGNSSANEPM